MGLYYSSADRCCRRPAGTHLRPGGWYRRVDTVGVDADMIRKHVKYQEKQEQRQVQMNLTR